MEKVSDYLHEVISIVGCGPSALDCGAGSAPGFVIAVNGAFEYVKHDAALSMDGRFASNCVPRMFGAVPIWLRDRAYRKLKPAELSSATRHHINVFANTHTTTTFAENALYPTTSWQLNGDHSGYCALNFAYSLRPRVVYLYGFDLHDTDIQHFFGRYPWDGLGSNNSPTKFAKWRKDMFAAAVQFDAKGIRVFNTSRNSAIKAFEFGRPAA